MRARVQAARPAPGWAMAVLRWDQVAVEGRASVQGAAPAPRGPAPAEVRVPPLESRAAVEAEAGRVSAEAGRVSAEAPVRLE